MKKQLFVNGFPIIVEYNTATDEVEVRYTPHESIENGLEREFTIDLDEIDPDDQDAIRTCVIKAIELDQKDQGYKGKLDTTTIEPASNCPECARLRKHKEILFDRVEQRDYDIMHYKRLYISILDRAFFLNYTNLLDERDKEHLRNLDDHKESCFFWDRDNDPVWNKK